MATSQTRYNLLRVRLRRLPPLVRRVEKIDSTAIPLVRAALWRLREVLPVLQLDPDRARKLALRLRRVGRRLGRVRDLDVQRDLIDEVSEFDRSARSAATRVAHDIGRRRVGLGPGPLSQKAATDLRRNLRKLAAILAELRTAGDSSTSTRAIRWALKARLARRAATLKRALDAVGSVYWPGRLRRVRTAVRKLHVAADVVADVVATGVPDLGPVELVEEALDRLRSAERLIARVRRLQAELAPPDPKAWQDLDALVVVLENRCRGLHARYVRERATLVALCDRCGARTSAQAASKRKVS